MAKCRRSTPKVRTVFFIVKSTLVQSIAIIAIGSFVGGCTAIKATVQMADAEKALNSAREFGAQDMATYEYTMAMRYLEKAKEEISYNEFLVSENLSKKSQEWSDKAIIFIQRGGRMDLSGEDFGTVPDKAILPDELPDAPVDDPGDDDLWESTTVPDAPKEPDPEDDFDFDEDEEDFDMENP